jgi:hypothetical protein
MAEDLRDGEPERFLAERGGHLLRAAVLLTGSGEAGEDLVQAALERLLRRGSASGAVLTRETQVPYSMWSMLPVASNALR